MTTVTARARRTAELVDWAESQGGLENWGAALSSAESLLAALRTRCRFQARVNHAPHRDSNHDAPEAMSGRRRHSMKGARMVPYERGL
jgi:hypothetical protein